MKSVGTAAISISHPTIGAKIMEQVKLKENSRVIKM